MTVPDVVMVVLRGFSILVNRMEGASFIAVALSGGPNHCLCTTPLEDLAAVA